MMSVMQTLGRVLTISGQVGLCSPHSQPKIFLACKQIVPLKCEQLLVCEWDEMEVEELEIPQKESQRFLLQP